MLAARTRFRPIVMTSLAFSFGVLPLALANGAGSGAQNAVGTGVVGGMVASTLFGILFIPVFFVVILRLFKVQPTKSRPPARCRWRRRQTRRRTEARASSDPPRRDLRTVPVRRRFRGSATDHFGSPIDARAAIPRSAP